MIKDRLCARRRALSRLPLPTPGLRKVDSDFNNSVLKQAVRTNGFSRLEGVAWEDRPIVYTLSVGWPDCGVLHVRCLSVARGSRLHAGVSPTQESLPGVYCRGLFARCKPWSDHKLHLPGLDVGKEESSTI